MHAFTEEIREIRRRVAELRTKYTQDAWNRGIEKAGMTESAMALRHIHDSTFTFEHEFEQENKQ